MLVSGSAAATNTTVDSNPYVDADRTSPGGAGSYPAAGSTLGIGGVVTMVIGAGAFGLAARCRTTPKRNLQH